MKQILPRVVDRDIKVVANAGGVNVEGCAIRGARSRA